MLSKHVTSTVTLQRKSSEPVMRPRPELQWERGAVLNAALVKDANLVGGHVVMFAITILS